MHALSFVRVTGPGGLDRVYALLDYVFLPSATLLGTKAGWATRTEYIAQCSGGRRW